MFKKILAIIVAVLIVGIVINNVIKASQFPKFPEATIAENPESEYTDIIVEDKRYVVFERDIADDDVDKTEKVAMYKNNSSFLLKYTSFYKLDNDAGCDMIVDDMDYAIFCNSDDVQTAEEYYGNMDNYLYYYRNDADKLYDVEKMQPFSVIDTTVFETMNGYITMEVEPIEVLVSEESINEWLTVAAISTDGLIRKDYDFCKRDDGWYYCYGIMVSDNEDEDYTCIKIDESTLPEILK